MPSLTHERRGLAVGSLAGIGVNRPPAGTQAAPRLTGTDVTGVSYRVQASAGLNTASLAAGAARAALAASRSPLSDIEMIVVGTTTPDVLWPSTACLVQTELGLPMVAAFDLYAAETSLLTALNVATHYVKAGARSVLVIGAESDNQLVDLPGQGGMVRDRAAAAGVLRPADGPGGVLATVVGGTARRGPEGVGEEGLLEGIRNGVQECLEKADLQLRDIDLVVADQSAPEFMHAWARITGVASDRIVLDASRYGSLLAAAPFLVLHDLAGAGRLKQGMTVLLLQCGSGPVWAAACLRWDATGMSR
jgi:3-oxoacyl-[acyl-carrier-protein] synthase-3